LWDRRRPNEGCSSSLAAARLRQLGLERATDLPGGYQAWEQPQQKAKLAAHWDSAYAQGGHAARVRVPVRAACVVGFGCA
jgi:hypothetical protein